jgi:hypothetical protein|eukprot:scaffold530_cov223-Chaetoceros_neogracile.AAC.9
MGLSPSEKDTTPEPFIRAFLYCLQNVFDCILIKLIPLSIKTIILPSRENSELVDAFGGWRLAGVGRKRKRDVGQLVREFSTSVCVSAYDMPAWLNFHKEVTRPFKNHSARLFYFEISIYTVIVVIVCGWVGIITIASSFQCHAHIY